MLFQLQVQRAVRVLLLRVLPEVLLLQAERVLLLREQVQVPPEMQELLGAERVLHLPEAVRPEQAVHTSGAAEHTSEAAAEQAVHIQAVCTSEAVRLDKREHSDKPDRSGIQVPDTSVR